MPGVIIRRQSLLGGLAVAVLVIGALTGCGPDTGSAATGPSSGPSASGATAASDGPVASSAPASPSASPVLADGRSAAYLTVLDIPHRSITFDLIEFLTGDAAKKAWQKANPGSGDDGPDDDYYIVNDNPKLRTLPVAANVTVSVLQNDGGSPQTATITLAALPGYLAKAKPDTTDHKLSYNPWWLTVQNGQIVKIEEQFVP